jgi:hypothetical protein
MKGRRFALALILMVTSLTACSFRPNVESESPESGSVTYVPLFSSRKDAAEKARDHCAKQSRATQLDPEDKGVIGWLFSNEIAFRCVTNLQQAPRPSN